MKKVGLRQARTHFSRYKKMVKEGTEVMLTDRGKPVAIISPIPQQEDTQEERLRLLEEQGIISRAKAGPFPLHAPIPLGGKLLSEIVIENREDRF
ncbi:MAG: type II toxin-antitoxin system prevent-host-death family antitoxin [bacterium]